MAAISHCAICGADWRAGLTCEDAYHTLLAREFSDPMAGQVHHLTVICYMIQHDRYSAAAAAWARDMLEKLVVRGLSVADLSAAARSIVHTKTTPIARDPNAPPLVQPTHAWRMTVVDAGRAVNAEEHAVLVTTWARAVWDTIR